MPILLEKCTTRTTKSWSILPQDLVIHKWMYLCLNRPLFYFCSGIPSKLSALCQNKNDASPWPSWFSYAPFSHVSRTRTQPMGQQAYGASQSYAKHKDIDHLSFFLSLRWMVSNFCGPSGTTIVDWECSFRTGSLYERVFAKQKGKTFSRFLFNAER